MIDGGEEAVTDANIAEEAGMRSHVLVSSFALLWFVAPAPHAAENPAGQHGGPPRPFGRPAADWPNSHPTPEPPDTLGTLVPPQGDDLLEVVITNSYDSTMPFGVARRGTDTAHAFLAVAPDGTFRGRAILTASSRMKLPGGNCGPYGYGWQFADVVGVPIVRGPANEPAFYDEVHLPAHFRFLQNRQPSTYLRLEFIPNTAPAYSPRDPCQEEIPRSRAEGQFDFIPLNDAQWTIEGYSQAAGVEGVHRSGYAIAVPTTGKLNYEDHVSNGPPLPGLGALVQTRAVWYVTVTRFEDMPVGQ